LVVINTDASSDSVHVRASESNVDIAMNAGASNDRAWFLTTKETDAYEFPVYTGTEPLLWQDVLVFLQVPEDVLREMSTDGVIETCLTYPIYSAGMITSSQSMYAGFQNTLRDFNGFEELFRRDDAGQQLLALYQGIDQGRYCVPLVKDSLGV